MRKFATGSDETLQDAATKTLGQWLSADAGPVLLEVAKGNGKFANRALGGYIRLFRQFELPEAQRVAMAAQALEAANRPNERCAALDAMTRFPCVGTFELALSQIDSPGSEAAARAVCPHNRADGSRPRSQEGQGGTEETYRCKHQRERDRCGQSTTQMILTWYRPTSLCASSPLKKSELRVLGATAGLSSSVFAELWHSLLDKPAVATLFQRAASGCAIPV